MADSLDRTIDHVEEISEQGMRRAADEYVQFLDRLFDGSIKVKDLDWELDKDDKVEWKDNRFLRFRRWVENMLDFDFTIRASGDFKHGCVYVAIGGPTMFVCTGQRCVCRSWGGTHVTSPLSNELVSTINDVLSEIYDTYRGNVW